MSEEQSQNQTIVGREAVSRAQISVEGQPEAQFDISAFNAARSQDDAVSEGGKPKSGEPQPETQPTTQPEAESTKPSTENSTQESGS